MQIRLYRIDGDLTKVIIESGSATNSQRLSFITPEPVIIEDDRPFPERVGPVREQPAIPDNPYKRMVDEVTARRNQKRSDDN